jgi:hypothetical protein
MSLTVSVKGVVVSEQNVSKMITSKNSALYVMRFHYISAHALTPGLSKTPVLGAVIALNTN